MAIIGLTGGIGSGKSAAARQFAGLGIPIVDTDAIAHQLTEAGSPTLAQITACFGNGICNLDGTLNRARLRKIVFASKQDRADLEAIMHPAILACAKVLIAQNAETQPPYQIIVVPLLFETQHYANIIIRSLMIDCDEKTQIQRTLVRHQQWLLSNPQLAQTPLTEADICAVMAAQLSRAARIKMADDTIKNNGSQADLYANVLKMHEKYCLLCKKMV